MTTLEIIGLVVVVAVFLYAVGKRKKWFTDKWDRYSEDQGND